MPSSPFIAVRLVAAIAAAALCGHAQAALSVFTTSSSFAGATVAAATDTFATIANDTIPSPLTRSVGAYGYTAGAPDDLYGGGTAANPWLSTDLSGATITFSGFTGSASAIGGVFFGSDITGAFLSGQNLTITATDSLGATAVGSVTNATMASFIGFASTGTLASLRVDIGNTNAFASVDNLMIAQTAPIPEPQTYALLLAGLGLAGSVARRRRHGHAQ